MKDTMNIQIVICDDEQKMISNISEVVKDTVSLCDISCFLSGKDLVESLENERYDLLLLDIDMPGITGLDIAKSIANSNPKPLIIFVTSHDELVYDSLQFHPFGFVRKSYMDRELVKVLKDAISEIRKKEKRFHYRTATDDVSIKLEDILYFESDGNYIKLFSKAEEDRFRATMSSVENTLGVQGFVRIHKGFIVNQKYVKKINSEECTLSDGVVLPIGRSYSESARKKMMRYMIR